MTKQIQIQISSGKVFGSPERFINFVEDIDPYIDSSDPRVITIELKGEEPLPLQGGFVDSESIKFLIRFLTEFLERNKDDT